MIDANQAGNANYNAAPQVQQSGPVAKGDQTITFTSTFPATAKVGGPTYTVTATGGASGQPVIFTIDATATSVCSISGSTVSFIGAGTCVIDANQAGNANYNAATQAQQSGPVSKGDQTITFTSTAPVGAAVGGPTYTVTATASSGLTVTFTIDATATSVCSISGSTVSFIGVGTCVIDANQAGNANYNPAPQVQQSFAVAKGNQTISFTSTPPVGATVGGPTYTVTATATSGLTVIFTIDATATSVCSISGSTVSFIGAGTCVIDANQPGDANWNAAPQVQQSFAVAKANQTISFTSTAPINAKVSGPTYTVSAMATSGLAVTFTIDASATSVCSISGATVSFIGGGTCVIDANQAGNANYNAAPQVQQSFLVAKNDQTITFTSTPPVNASVGGPTYTVTATASSGLTVTFTIDASATSVCSISGSTVSFIGGGTCVIDADQAGNFAYNPAPQVQQSFHVNQPPMLTTNPISYTTPGNTQLHVGAVLPGVAAWTDAQNITAKAQPTDSDGPGTLSIVAASGTTANGGTYSVSAPNGIFTYVPAAGFTGTDSFTYQVTDTQSTTTGTVNITVGPRVWYIRDIVDTDNPAGGDGRSTNAFDSIAAFNAATTNNGDIIFIFRGNTGTTPLSGNLTLKDGQKLWGQGIALDLTSSGFGVLVGAGSKPVISSTGDAVSVPATAGNRQNVEVRGLDITATGNGVKVNATGANNVSVTISDDNLSSTSTAGLNGVNLSAGSTGTFAATLNNNAISTTGATANGNAFDARTSAATTMTIDFSNNAVISKATGILIDGSGGGTTTITGFANNAVDPANTGTGISITSAKFDATPGGSYQTVSGGTTVLGVMGNGMGGSGVVLSNVSGDLAFTNLQSFADGGAAFRLTGTGVVNTGAGTGTRVTVGAGVGIFEAVAGPAVDVTNATIDLQLSSLKSMGSATTGVSLDTVTGTFSAGSGSTITSATGTDFNVNAGNAAVTYNGTISDTTGRLVSVTNTTGGTKSFTGTISDTGSGTGQGIFLNSNTGAAISFTGALTLSTGSADAFTATGGGTVTAAPSTGVNTLTTTTGTALKVQNTTIGASGLSFRSISAGTAASGPTNGIVLSSTGTSGGLTVSGTGSAGSGGTIQKTTAEGILITGPANASFSWMSIQNPGTHGISATTANNLTIANTTITDAAGNNTVDDGIHTSNTTGALTITSCTINGARHQGITIDNNNTNMAALSMTGTTVTNTPGGDGMLMQMRGTSVLTTGTISNNTFSNNSATGLQVNNADTGNISSLMVQTNTVTSNNAGMDFDLSQAASMTVVVQGNTITGSHSQALNLVTSTSATGGSMTATLRNNNIGTAGVNDSGSAIGSGIRVANGGLNVSLTIDGNVIREVPNGRGIDVEAQAYASNLNLKAQIINNQVVRPSGTNQNIGCGANVPCPSASIFVLSDSNGLGGFDHVCTAISGNSAYDPTSWPAGGEAAFYFARRTSASNTLSLEGTQANVTNQILATNTVTNFTTTKVIDENTSGTVTIVPAGNCGGFPP
ncbi:MAG TPA: Ig-like domain-containing protein [Thermoanaerobaculia bacterium]